MNEGFLSEWKDGYETTAFQQIQPNVDKRLK